MSAPTPRAREVIANLGGEEGDLAWRRAADLAPVRAARAAFGALFGSDREFAQPFGGAASPHVEPAFDWLCGDAYGQWYDESAPAVRIVHDKAFAVPHSGRSLCDVIAVYSASDLSGIEHATQDMTRRMASWPGSMRERFCLKPRIGSSGRGRVAGRSGDANTDAIRSALPRLASRGGALLEPWLDRTQELSVALYADGSGGPLSFLGSLDAITTPHGVPVGHSGEIDNRGRIYSRSRYDDDVRAAAIELAGEAVALGFRGPCGVDAFAYQVAAGEGRARVELRPVVEFNARFTMGLVALGALRRARAEIRAALGVAPGDRVGFVFAAWHREGWSKARAELARHTRSATHWSPVATSLPLDPEHGPAILVAREVAALEPIVTALRSGAASSRERDA